MYKYEILDPRPSTAAKEANDKIFFEAQVGVLGIEVTVPAVVSRCTLGNIDPQHSGENVELAAIEDAFTIKLPPNGCTLATIRADLDAIGAMAVISIRANGIEPDVDAEGYSEFHARISMVSMTDKFARGGWPGPRPLPSVEKLFDDSVASAETDSRLAPIAAAVADFKVPIAERVAWMEHWLLTGEEPTGYREKFLTERRAIAEAVTSGQIQAELVADGSIARVVSTHRAATSIGYCLAPVVVALNPAFRFQGGEPHAKFTVCQFTADYVDLKAALAELSGLEQGWGGSPTIGGSPQGASSTLTIDQVVEVVAKHLK